MIYLQNTTESQVMFIPRNGGDTEGGLVFKAKSTIDLAIKINASVVEMGTSDLYHKVSISLPANIPNGEYEYTLADSVNVLSSGLLIIGESASPSQYNQEITYEQYTTE